MYYWLFLFFSPFPPLPDVGLAGSFEDGVARLECLVPRESAKVSDPLPINGGGQTPAISSSFQSKGAHAGQRAESPASSDGPRASPIFVKLFDGRLDTR